MPETDVPSLARVAAFYDNVAAMDIVFGRSIHLGLWPDGDDGSSLADAQDRLTDLVAVQCGAHAGALLLDVGCGTGGPARHLARAAGVSVTGITISPQQTKEATARTAEEGLTDRVRCLLADAANLPFGDGVFDAAIAIESILHMTDKLRVLRELFRVLRPGAILTIADFSQTSSNAITSDMESATAVLTLAAAATPDEYLRLARTAGFQVADSVDLGPTMCPSWPRLGRRLDEQHTELTAVIGEQMVSAMKEIIRLYNAAAAAGIVGYLLLSVRKPT